MGITRMCPIALLLVACAVMACGAGPLSDGGAQGGGSKGGDFSDPEIEDRCHESFEISVSTTAHTCECRVAAGEYADQATCVAERAISETDLDRVDCICSTYARYPESSTFIDCFVPRQQAYANCIVDALCEQAKLDACAEKYGSPVLQCQPPADAADEAAAMCTSP